MDEAAEVLFSGTCFSVGNGARVRFWTQEWIPGIILKFVFPRIFALALNKEGFVKEFGSVVNGVWEWSIHLQRPLFDWERTQWDMLMVSIQEFHINEGLEDNLIWKSSTSGKYLVKDFCYQFSQKFGSMNPLWDNVWTGLIPPKVEAFCWRLLKGRIPVKVNLAARSSMGGGELKCPFCGQVDEEVDHLFFDCYYSWLIWKAWGALWDITWVGNKSRWCFFEEWFALKPRKACVKIWRMAFGAIIWSIWLYRNDVVFNGKRLDINVAMDLIKLRLANWIKAKWPETSASITELIYNPQVFVAPVKVGVPRVLSRWAKPLVGWLKFNVDGSSLGKPGISGIGGILRNHEGNID
ncbi:hypothetical protein PTKIN_Ptkin01aG0390000 [Pterospermum kingtungense]